MRPPQSPSADLQRVIRRAVLLAIGQLAACGGDRAPIYRTDIHAPIYRTDIHDAGACTPSLLSGQAGFVALWPCGAPMLSAADARSSFDRCADLCLGNHSFNSCNPMPENGEDGGSEATIVRCSVDATGRRPAGLVDSMTGIGEASVGNVLARAAFLEAASVDAFLNLALELEQHAAPKELVRRAREAAQDEVRHAEAVGGFARRCGTTPAPVHIVAPPTRELLDIALDNAREGCVRETYGVASALAQAWRGENPQLRAVMQTIAIEELRHAELSWDLEAWLDSRLDADGRARVAQERQRAVDELCADLASPLPGALRSTLGIPSAAEAMRIAASLRSDLWSAGA